MANTGEENPVNRSTARWAYNIVLSPVKCRWRRTL